MDVPPLDQPGSVLCLYSDVAYVIWFGTHKEYNKIDTDTIEFDTSILNYKSK